MSGVSVALRLRDWAIMLIFYVTIIIVTVRAKTSLVHTSDFTKLRACKNFYECYKEIIFSAVIK